VAIDNPQVKRFCNERVRQAADLEANTNEKLNAVMRVTVNPNP
jgi:hypothetical protein